MEETSSYKALKKWNAMQEECYRIEQREVVYYDDFDKYTDMQGNPKPEYQSKWENL